MSDYTYEEMVEVAYAKVLAEEIMMLVEKLKEDETERLKR